MKAAGSLQLPAPVTGCCSKSRLLLAAMWLGSRSALHREARAEQQGRVAFLSSVLLMSLSVSLAGPCVAGSPPGARGAASAVRPPCEHASFLLGCIKAEQSRDDGATAPCSDSRVWHTAASPFSAHWSCLCTQGVCCRGESRIQPCWDFAGIAS